MPKSLPPPLGGAAPPEVPLARLPLARVVMQVRFSPVLRIESRDGIAAFQEEVRNNYPHFEQVSSTQFQIDLSSGPQTMTPIVTTISRFWDADRTVRLSLGSSVVTLDAFRYESRTAFLDRWADILARIERLYTPTLTLRTGARYVNRIVGDGLKVLTDLVEPNLIGVAQPNLREYVTQALSEASMEVEEGQLLLRWGVLAANTTIDPDLIDPVPEPSWILDIDVFSGQQKPFSSVGLRDEFRGLAERSYALFRHALTDHALDHFGAVR